MITIARLIAAGLAPTQARIFADPLSAACAKFEINTPNRIGAFLGQAMQESAKFTAMEESLLYRRPEWIRQVFSSYVHDLQQASTLVCNPKALANTVYSNRLGNGDAASGEGWLYRGRGVFQLTGKANYAAASAALGVDYVRKPDLVALPPDACLTAASYFIKRNGHLLADAWSIDAITRSVNPAMLHAVERKQASDDARRAFS